MKSKIQILIVDDEAYVRDSLSEVLRLEGFEVKTASGAKEALALLAKKPVQVILTDLKMPDGDGQLLLEEARRAGVEVPIIVITGAGTIHDAVSTIKAGAYDFVTKPIDPEQLVMLVRRAAEHRGLRAEVEHLRKEVAGMRAAQTLIGESASMRSLKALIGQVARTDSTVLITGESGVGKELVAEELHRASQRSSGPLVRVNCAAIPDELFESEFFGHRRGALAGAVEDRSGRFSDAEFGTLVLDEVGTLRPGMQAKLLRVLETGEYQVVGESRTRQSDVRVIAITNEDLASRVKNGEFRSDLYYRLNVFPIAVPPLRLHKEDLQQLGEYLLESAMRRGGAALGQTRTPLEADALEVLGSYDWPGNVRELRNVLERALIISNGGQLSGLLLRSLLEPGMAVEAVGSNSGGGVPDGRNSLRLRTNLDAAEKDLILKALAHSEGRKKEAAYRLGIDPRNLGYYLRKHQIAKDAD